MEEDPDTMGTIPEEKKGGWGVGGKGGTVKFNGERLTTTIFLLQLQRLFLLFVCTYQKKLKLSKKIQEKLRCSKPCGLESWTK